MKIIEKILSKSKNLSGEKAPTIVFLGDSLTQGILKTTVDHNNVYHNKLKKMIEFLFPSTIINIINSGIGGTTAAFACERIQRDVLDYSPDLCVVCFGLNDVNGREEGLATYISSLDTIFKTLNNNGIETIFMTPNMMNTEFRKENTLEQFWGFAQSTSQIQNSGMLDKYMDAAKICAKENHVIVCDCYEKWKKLAAKGVDTNLLLANAINHPVKEMHTLFAYSLLETMFN